nr:MAG TPA: hypothetical protein [Caudoviricetes sp.]
MERNKVAKFPILRVEQVNHIVRVHAVGFQTKRTKVSLDDFERGGNTLVTCLTNRQCTLSEVSASAFVTCGHDSYGRVATTLPSQLHCIVQEVEREVALSDILRCINAVLEGEGSHRSFFNLTFTRGDTMTIRVILDGVHSTFWTIVQVERISVLNCYVVGNVFFTFSTTTNDEGIAIYKAVVVQSEHTSSYGCTFQFIFKEVRDTTESASNVFRHRGCSGVVDDSVLKVSCDFLASLNELVRYFITNAILLDSLSDIRDVVTCVSSYFHMRSDYIILNRCYRIVVGISYAFHGSYLTFSVCE